MAKDIDVEIHEGAHALASFYYGIPIRSVSVYPAKGEAGRCRLKNNGKATELDVATMCVAGRMAEKRALGFDEVFNWFDDDDTDTANAIKLVDAMVEAGDFNGDVFEARHWVEIRARSLLASKWSAVSALAEKLRVHHLLTGAEVADICKREGVRPYGDIRREEILKKLTPEGRRRLRGKVAPDGTIIERATKER